MEQSFYVESQGFLLRKVSKFCLKVIRNKKKNQNVLSYVCICILYLFLILTCHGLLLSFVCSFFFQKGKQLNNKTFNGENIKCIKAYFNVTIMCRYRKTCGVFFLAICNLKKKNKA